MFHRDNDRPPRQMVQGNWTCSDCGAEITELPFEPAPGKEICCRECWMKKRPKRDFAPRERRTVQGNWTCSDCGAEITELPFEPAAGKPIYCRECWKKNRPPRY